LTLGCLLSEELDIELRRVGSGKRMTFAEGEGVLSQWMADNAFVCWHKDDIVLYQRGGNARQRRRAYYLAH